MHITDTSFCRMLFTYLGTYASMLPEKKKQKEKRTFPSVSGPITERI